MRWLVLITLAGGLACRGGAPPLHPAGTGHDDGHGDLSRAALAFTRVEDSESTQAEATREDGAYGGETYGAIPPWQYSTSNRVKYPPATGASGSIEGVVSWRGPIPAARTSACGPVEVMKVGGNRGIADVLVYIERVRTDARGPVRGPPPASAGSWSSAVAHCDRRCRSRAAPGRARDPRDHSATHCGDRADRAPPRYELQEAGRVAMQVQPGVTGEPSTASSDRRG